ncbi:MAG: GNAT family N-acetyltransferase [Planctomycetaceae bacterium]
MFQVVEMNTLAELKAYRMAWEDLWLRGRTQRYSLSSDWFEAYARLVSDRGMKVLVISLAGKVIGILPLVLKQVHTRLGSQRVLTYPLDGWGNWYGPIGPNPAATLTAGLRYLTTTRRDWDLLDLPYVDRDRHDLGRTQTAARNIGWNVTERLWRQIPLIQLVGSWSEFLSSKRTEVLDEILQAERRIDQLGQVQLWRYRSGVHASADLERLLNAWKLVLSATGRAGEFAMLEHLALAADQRNQLDLSALVLDQLPLACGLGFVQGATVELVQGMSHASSACTSGRLSSRQVASVLLGRLLEQGIALGDDQYEICPTCEWTETARALWSTDVLNSYRYSMAPWSHLRSALLVRYHAARTSRIPRKQFSDNPRRVVQEQRNSTAPQLKIYR